MTYLIETIEVPKEVLEIEFERLKANYKTIIARNMKNYIAGAIHKMERDYGVSFVQEMTAKEFDVGVEIHLRVYIDAEELMKLKESLKKFLQEKRATTLIWTGALKSIKEGSLKSSSGELDALLSDSAQRPAEALGKAGGDRAKVRGQEGRPHPEGDSEIDKRGVHINKE
jgi:hypothetical protein